MSTKRKTKANGLRNRGRAQKSPRTLGTGSTGLAAYQAVVYKQPGQFCPTSVVTNLRFEVFDSIVGVATGNSSIRFRSSAFDVDPLLGSTTMPGFAELAAQYFYYRVILMGFSGTITNLDSQPYQVGFGFTNNDVGANNFVSGLFGGKLCKTTLLSGKGGMDRAKIHQVCSSLRVVGSKQALTDDLYASLCTTNPSNMWYWNCGVQGQAVQTLGCLLAGYFCMRVLFYESKPLAS